MLDAMDAKANEVLPEHLVEIVKFHTRGGVACGLASAWIPGAGGTIASVGAVGFIWSMYVRINEAIEMPFSDNVLKIIATGVATNLASAAAVNIIVSSAFSLFPGIGTVAATVLTGATMYAVTLSAGYLYFKLMTELFKSGLDLNNISINSLKDMALNLANSDDIKSFFKGASKEFKEKNKQGEFGDRNSDEPQKIELPGFIFEIPKGWKIGEGRVGLAACYGSEIEGYTSNIQIDIDNDESDEFDIKKLMTDQGAINTLRDDWLNSSRKQYPNAGMREVSYRFIKTLVGFQGILITTEGFVCNTTLRFGNYFIKNSKGKVAHLMFYYPASQHYPLEGIFSKCIETMIVE